MMSRKTAGGSRCAGSEDGPSGGVRSGWSRSGVIAGIVAAPLLAVSPALAATGPIASENATTATTALTTLAQLTPGTAWALASAGIAAAVTLGITAHAGILKRDGLDTGREGPARALASPLWLVAAALAFIVQGMGAQAAISLGLELEGGIRDQALARVVATAIGVAGAVGLAMIVARAAPGAGLRFRVKDLWVGLVAFALAIPVVAFTSIVAAEVGQALLGPSGGPAHNTLRLLADNRTDPWAWAFIATAVIGAPIAEEITYRGFLQSALLAATRRAWISVLVTAALFTAAHWPALPPDGRHALAPLFVLGVALGIVVERTKSLGAAIVLHALFNAGNIALTFALDAG